MALETSTCLFNLHVDGLGIRVVRTKRQKRRHHRNYRYPGQEIGEPLAYWLNGPGAQSLTDWARQMIKRFPHFSGLSGNAARDRRARGRVLELIAALQEIEEVHELVTKGLHWHSVLATVNRLKNPEEQARRLLERYAFYPTVSANRPYMKGTQRKFLYGDRALIFQLQGRGRYLIQETWAVRSLENLSKTKSLHRVRRCQECHRFYYAKDPKGVRCPQCRANLRHLRSHIEWRRTYDQLRKEYFGSDELRAEFATFREFYEKEKRQKRGNNADHE